MTITIKKTFRNCIISILLLGNISYSEDIPHLKILNDLKKSYEVKYSHFQEKSYYLNYAEELTNDFSGKKKSKVVYDYRSLVESIDKIEDLLKLIEIVDKEIPPLRGLELYPNYFTSELINKYKEWENYYVDKSFFDKGAFYPYGVTLFEGVFGNMYYIDDGSCAPYNYEYWYRTTKSLTLTNKYTQQKVYCTGCRDAKEALPKLWENYRSTKDIKDRKKRILQESIKSKIKLINNDVMKIIEEVNFQLPSLKSDVSLIKQSLLNILTELEKNSVKIKSREIINPKKLTEKIRILKDQIQLVFENYNLSINAENLEDAKYYLYRYNYLTNRTNTIVETKKTEKISFSNKIDFVIYFVAALPPVFVVSSTKSGVVPDIGLSNLFCIKNALNLCVSITGDKLGLPVSECNVKTIVNDLSPDISFVSLICEAIIPGLII